MQFFQTINSSFIGKFINKKLDLIAHTDPERIYVENIRSFYNIPIAVAKTFCEMATKENLFVKRVGVECPNEACHRIVASYGSIEDVPDTISCENCELLEQDKCEFKKGECKTIEFYKLNKEFV